MTKAIFIAGIGLGLMLALLASFYLALALRDVAAEIEKRGLKGVVEQVWCGEKGCA